jgi:outer membrane receptor protein involved in Fe transport
MAIRMRLPNDAHFLADLADSVPVRRGLQGFVQIENLFDRRYVGVNNGFIAPFVGKPLTAMFCARLKLEKS